MAREKDDAGHAAGSTYFGMPVNQRASMLIYI